ncbi:beta-1,3-galactosyltransferase 1-like [Panulirus ornatus]|uniref:beta-1,3-galactosyltransferase 1-like n=1 Tax=Panulirus ornatus TaxID=150431 RepID=UPI003A87389A
MMEAGVCSLRHSGRRLIKQRAAVVLLLVTTVLLLDVHTVLDPAPPVLQHVPAQLNGSGGAGVRGGGPGATITGPVSFVLPLRRNSTENGSVSGLDQRLRDSTNLTGRRVGPVPTAEPRPQGLQQKVQEHYSPVRPYKERFRFIYSRERVSLGGPKVNPVPRQVSWRHQLAHVTVCNTTQPFILAVVPSALANTSRRKQIRSSWADPLLYPHTRLRAVFVLGATLDAALQEAVDAEVAIHDDIIQSNFIDSYKNLTYKTLSWLTWVASRCPDVPFVAKVDDDVLVNPFHLRTFFLRRMASDQRDNRSDESRDGEELPHSATRYIYGRLETQSRPHRRGKWGLTMEEYPEEWFPPFVLGPAYVVGRDAVRRLVQYASHTPFLPLEDVFTTGLVAHAAGVPHVQAAQELYALKSFHDVVLGDKAFLTENSELYRNLSWTRIIKHFRMNPAADSHPLH